MGFYFGVVVVFGVLIILFSNAFSLLSPSHDQAQSKVSKIMDFIDSNKIIIAKSTKQRQLLYTDKYKHSSFLTGKEHGDNQCSSTNDQVEFAVPMKQWYGSKCWRNSSSGYLSVDDVSAGRSSKVIRCSVGTSGNIQVEAQVFSNLNCSGIASTSATYAIRDDNGVVVQNGACVTLAGYHTELSCTDHYSFKAKTGHVIKSVPNYSLQF